jgi:ABC-type Fe3+-citrate transport system substrate-binding protein
VHPKETLRKVPKVGGTKSVNLEKVRALRPTHVIVNVDENKRETAAALAEFVPNVIVTHPLAPLDNLSLYRQIGAAFGKDQEAQALCNQFKTAYGKLLQAKFPRRKVLYLIWKNPWMTVSRDTYVARMLALFGLDTLPARSVARYPELQDLGLPGIDLILLPTEPYRFRDSDAKEIQEAAGKPTHLIDGEMTSWYGPRAIAGLRYLSDFAAML